MKEITVLAFGTVGDIIGKSQFALSNISSTEEVKEKLEAEFPPLKVIPYAIAVNKQLVSRSTGLASNDTVALLPPFSGG